MAYDETPKKPIEIRQGRTKYGHDDCIKGAQAAGKYGDRTDAAAQGVGYLGMDDIDRMRRKDWVRT